MERMTPGLSWTVPAEREALCTTLLAVGPDAPTLCEGWTARDLAAHLVVRERRPDAAVGLWLRAFATRTEQVQAGVADRPFEELVATVRKGPPPYHPATLPVIDELTNAAEVFVHHEDVRRAAPGWEPRDLDPAHERTLWRTVRTLGRATYRRSPVGVVLDAPGYGRVTVNGKEDPVVVTGAPGELVLHAFGRGDHARVALDGAPAAVEALAGTSVGLG